MEKEKILNADFLDIIFDGKNKDYGAYELRKSYQRRLLKALAAMTAVCLAFFITTLFANERNGKIVVPVKDVFLSDYPPKDEKEIVKPPEPLPKPKPITIATIQYTNFDIVKDDKVTEQPPEQADLDDAKISTMTAAGDKFDDYVSPPVETKGTGAELPVKPEIDYNVVFRKVEKEAKFPGGLEAWKKYLERNLNSQVAADDGAAMGRYTVLVQFIVDKEGNISNVSALEVPPACPSCGAEAVKVIKKGGKWEPAVQNGQFVKYQAVQSVTFQVAE